MDGSLAVTSTRRKGGDSMHMLATKIRAHNSLQRLTEMGGGRGNPTGHAKSERKKKGGERERERERE